MLTGTFIRPVVKWRLFSTYRPRPALILGRTVHAAADAESTETVIISIATSGTWRSAAASPAKIAVLRDYADRCLMVNRYVRDAMTELLFFPARSAIRRDDGIAFFQSSATQRLCVGRL
jgi:hypothetical protein